MNLQRLVVFGAITFLFCITTIVSAQNRACSGFDSRLRIGGEGIILPGDPNNIRSEPTRSSSRVGQIPAGGVFEVLDGPRCADNVTWWYVRYRGITGWTGEGNATEVWADPVGGENTAAGAGSGQNGIETVVVTVRTPPNGLQGLSLGLGGGGGYCVLPPQRGTVIEFSVDQYQPGSAIRLDVDNIRISADLPVICSATPIDISSAIAISPDGEQYALEVENEPSFSFFTARLPLGALLQPGVWEISANGDSYSVTISPARFPRVLVETDGFESEFLFTGFASNERVIGILYADGFGELQVQMNSDGHYIGMSNSGVGAVEFAIGEFGSYYEFNPGMTWMNNTELSSTEMRELLYSIYWG
jgi:hypothetical protein